jgi:hypothetical protein
MSSPKGRVGYVGVNGSVGTVHFLSHEAGADLIRFFDQVRPLLARAEITDIWVSGHTDCSTSPRVMSAFLLALRDEAERTGKSVLVRPTPCSIREASLDAVGGFGG